MRYKEYFWTQREYIPEEIGYNQFSKKHLLMLLITFIISGLFAYIYKISNIEFRETMRIAIAITLLILEIVKLVAIYFGDGKVLNYLPLEVCSFAAYSIVVDALLKNSSFITVMLLILFLPAAIMALLYPTTINCPAFNFYTIHQFLYHGLIVMYVIARFISNEINLTYLGVWQSILTILVLVFLIYLIDITFKKNYMFLIHDEGSSLLKKIYDISTGGKKYTIYLVIFSIIVIHIFYLFFKLIQILFIH